jgi:hypothetical protein
VGLGGGAFWIPEILLYAYHRTELDRGLITVLLPAAFLSTYVVVQFARPKESAKPSAAVFMLLGAWICGPLAISIGMTLLGAGFAAHPVLTLLSVLLGTVVPLYTFIMATYDGSLYALFLVTVIMPLFHCLIERGNWIRPPRAHGDSARSSVSQRNTLA